MAIKVVGKVAARQYKVTCTDDNCRNIIEFDQDDVKNITRYAAGRECGLAYGIKCPDCNQILELSEAEEIK